MLIKKNPQTAYKPAIYEGINLTFSERILLSHHFLPDDDPEDDELEDDRDELIDPEQKAGEVESALNEDDGPALDEEDLKQSDFTTEQPDAVERDPEGDEQDNN